MQCLQISDTVIMLTVAQFTKIMSNMQGIMTLGLIIKSVNSGKILDGVVGTHINILQLILILWTLHLHQNNLESLQSHQKQKSTAISKGQKLIHCKQCQQLIQQHCIFLNLVVAKKVPTPFWQRHRIQDMLFYPYTPKQNRTCFLRK
jgi:hypothetical protein